MGKRKQERERIIALILERAAECEAGKPVYHFDVGKPGEGRVDGAELRRHGLRLRALARELGHKEAGEGNGG